MRIASRLFIVSLAVLAACSEVQSGGSFAVHFRWQDQAPTTDEEWWLAATLVQRNGSVETIIQDPPAVRLSSSTQLDFSRIPYGKDYVVAARVRASSARSARAAYYGESEPFALRPGKHITVPVALELTATPAPQETRPVLTILEARNGAVNRRVVTLAVAASNAARLLVANDLSLQRGRSDRALSELKRDQSGDYLWTGWDVDAGCEGPACSEDGPRTVYVQLFDQFGNESEVFSASVSLDTRAPGAVASLLREPFYAPASAQAGKVLFSRVDPVDPAQPVTARLVLTASETLAMEPEPRVTARGPGGSSLSFSLVPGDPDSRVLEFVHTMQATDRAGDYVFEVDWSDELGNRTPRPELGISLTISDTHPQGAMGMGETIYRRAPWGEASTNGEPRLSVSGKVALPTDVAELIAYRQRSALPATQMGRTLVATDGTFQIDTLSGGDSPELYLVPVTSAGVRGEPQLVTRGVWVATMGGKALRNELGNPHVFTSWSESPQSLRPTRRIGSREEASAALSSLGDGGPRVDGSAGWTQIKQPSRTSGEQGIGRGVVYDSARGVLVVFGGRIPTVHDDQTVNQTLEWDGYRWEERQPEHRPPQMFKPAMAYDSRRGKTVLVSDLYTWEWDGSDWSAISPPAGSPVAANPAAIAFDEARGLTLLVNEEGTWTWDGADWTQHSVELSPAPGPMAYDRKRHQVVLLHNEDTWLWDGTSWASVPNGSKSPGAGQIVYDVSRERPLTVTWSASTADQPGDAQVWAWDGSGWELLSSEAGPQPHYLGALVYDTKRNVLMLFGGDRHLGAYTWNGSWAEDRALMYRNYPDSWPTARTRHAMAYDPSLEELVIFGGLTSVTFFERTNDTWSWDGVGWRQHRGNAPPWYVGLMSFGPDGLTMFQPVPPESPQQAMGVWLREGDGWNELVQTYDPGWVHGMQVAVDASGTFTIANSTTGTWDGDGIHFTFSEGSSPGPLPNQAMAYATHRERMVIVDPTTERTWERDASGLWLSMDTPEIAGLTGSIQYDSRRRKILFFGTEDDPSIARAQRTPRTLEWDGQQWSELQLVDAPAPRTGHALAADESLGRIFLFGGYDGNLVNDELWSWRLADVTPMQTFQVNLTAAGIPGARHRALSLRWTAGAVSQVDRAERTGACLRVWHTAEFAVVDCNEAPLATPETLSFQTDDPAVMGELIHREALHVAATPLGVNGTGLAKLATDYVELELSYDMGEPSD